MVVGLLKIIICFCGHNSIDVCLAVHFVNLMVLLIGYNRLELSLIKALCFVDHNLRVAEALEV